MNLRAVANGLVTAINPDVLIAIQVSTGPIEQPDGSQTPGYATPVQVMGQIQSLTFGDIQQADNLNIQGIRRALYINGEVDGLIREKNKGGDLVQLADGTIWLVAHVLEYWPQWTKAIITLQEDVALPAPNASAPSTPLRRGQTDVGGGQIRYAEASGSAPIQIAANTRTLISFVIDPTQTNDYLNFPFEGQVSFDGTTITPRPNGMGDFYHILINLLVTSQVAGGTVRFDVDVGSPAGPTGSDTAGLFNDAGVPERVTGNLYIQVLANFMQNGAKLYLTSSVPISIVNEAVLISCESS